MNGNEIRLTHKKKRNTEFITEKNTYKKTTSEQLWKKQEPEKNTTSKPNNLLVANRSGHWKQTTMWPEKTMNWIIHKHMKYYNLSFSFEHFRKKNIIVSIRRQSKNRPKNNTAQNDQLATAARIYNNCRMKRRRGRRRRKNVNTQRVAGWENNINEEKSNDKWFAFECWASLSFMLCVRLTVFYARH